MNDGYYNHSLAAWSEVPTRYEDLFFEDIVPRNDEQMEYILCLKDILNGKTGSLVCLGTVGNGKTLIACAAVNSYINYYPHEARYITQEALVDRIQSSYGDGCGSEGQIVSQFVSASILVIDEVTTRRWTESAKAIIQKIISQRYEHKKRTVLIGNIDATTFKNMFDAHILSRLRTGDTIIMLAPDMRVHEEV